MQVVERVMTYVPSVRQGLFQVDDAAEDESEDGSEILSLVGTNGDLNEALGNGHAFVEIGRFQNRSFAPETELRMMQPSEAIGEREKIRTTLSRNFM